MKNRAQLYKFSDGRNFRNRAADEVFNEIYDRKAWNVKTFESVSGEGSSLAQTAALIGQLPPVLKRLGIKSVLDIPCGDFNWMQHVPMPGVHYTGADIVASLVETNRSKYGSEHRRFISVNLLTDALPAAGLIFCRDCLVHFSFRDIQLALQN
ncbi:MAG: class I SAM-dependent methyltransferase, partial [Saprospiraceae bacterium]